MRDIRFKSKHRGGLLDKNTHILLSKWASLCAEHVLNLLGENIDKGLIKLLNKTEEWREGKISIIEARKFAKDAFYIAKKSTYPIEKFFAYAIGHALATAHMADHSIISSIYSLKALKALNGSIVEEIKWQEENLTIEIKELIISAKNEDKYKKLLKK